MEKKIFDYRVSGVVGLAAFFAIWGSGWLFGMVSSGSNVRINGRTATPQEALSIQFFGVFLGGVALSAAVAAFLFAKNARVEIHNGWVKVVGLTGNVTFFANLHDCKVEESSSNLVGRQNTPEKSGSLRIVSDHGGSAKIYKLIRNFGQLRELIRTAGSGQPMRSVQVDFVPVRDFFYYGWGVGQMFCLLFMIVPFVVLWLAIQNVVSPSKNSIRVDSSVELLPLVFLVFEGLGGWVLLKGINEKILLTEAEIVWIDCLTRVKLTAPYGSLVDLYYNDNSDGGATLSLYTLAGTITVGSDLKDFDVFRSEMNRLLDLVKRVGETSQHQAVSLPFNP